LGAFSAARLVAADKPASADQIQAALESGIKTKEPGTKTKSKTPHKSNRVWTVEQLVAKFGEPTYRDGGEVEFWTWKRDDGDVRANFRNRGFGHVDDPKTQRLEIISVRMTHSEVARAQTARRAQEPADLVKARNAYKAEVEAAMAPITAAYLKQLEEMKKAYGAKGDLTSALALQKEIDTFAPIDPSEGKR
jgi:hypothetical protein